MAFTKKNEEAVSPVIGVILMVAITVILAAVIAAFVFGMAGNISKTKVVAMTTSKVNASYLTVMNQGGQDQASLNGFNVTTIPAPTSCSPGTLVAGTCSSTMPVVGSYIGAFGAYSSATKVTVVGVFNDGTSQVLLDTSV